MRSDCARRVSLPGTTSVPLNVQAHEVSLDSVRICCINIILKNTPEEEEEEERRGITLIRRRRRRRRREQEDLSTLRNGWEKTYFSVQVLASWRVPARIRRRYEISCDPDGYPPGTEETFVGSLHPGGHPPGAEETFAGTWQDLRS